MVDLRTLASRFTTGTCSPAEPVQTESAPRSYDSRVASERQFFEESRPSSDLPEIYQYWSNGFLRPRLLRAGFDGPADMFRASLAQAYDNSRSGVRRFLSIG